MDLPLIVLPQVELSFAIETLLHPLFVHFMMAFPIMVLFLEILNILMNKKTISGVNVFLLLLTLIISIAVYFTGLTDAKASLALLSEEAKLALDAHILLGTYLIFALLLVLFLKLLSTVMGNFFKSLYILVLFILVAGLLSQGRQGIKLVYTEGANVAKIKTLDSQIRQLEADKTREITQNKTLSVKIELLYKEKAEALQRVNALQKDLEMIKALDSNRTEERNITL